MAARSRQSCSSSLAWAGWQVRVPEHWRPLRIEGAWEKGSIILGDEGQAIMQVKWWRHENESFDGARWTRRRLKKAGAKAAADGKPAPPGFENAAWVPGRGPAQAAVWYGCAPAGRLVMEVVVSGEMSKKDQRTATSRALPTLKVSAHDAPTRWAIYGASFESPAGFVLCDRRLKLGDIALRLSSKRRERLVLRQVYPSALALARRELAKWLEFPVFREHRKYRPANPPQKWSVESFGRQLDGIRRAGRKRFPFPLGVLAPRYSAAAVVHDEQLGRLLVAEYDSRGAPDDATLADALASMNWAQLESGGEA